MAISSDMAFSKAALPAMWRGSTQSRLEVMAGGEFDDEATGRAEQVLAIGMRGDERTVPGRDRPSASVRQFIELAVNMPEHEPQVGQAGRSICPMSASGTRSSAAATMASTRSSATVFPASRVLPASIGPPETNTVGILRRIAAMSMPGVILSQLEMHTSASTQCALHMYSTLSAMISRDGKL